MTYEETIKYIFEALPMYQRIGSAAYKADLENAYELDKLSGYPHRAFSTIHIAGTNGKGSVSHMLASIYQKAGYKTGLYTSPHLLDYRERIKINGEPISKDFIIKYIQRNQCFFEIIKPSFFEMSVFMALCYFKTQKVDVAIIETGLGGRLDTTNIITPLASIITNIGYDHTQFLGSSLKQIAKEKAGIIKPGIPAIIGEYNDVTSKVFFARANLMESPLYFADQEYFYEYTTRNIGSSNIHRFSVNGNSLEVETDMLGMYQQKNIITCLQTLDVLKDRLPLKDEHVREGLLHVKTGTGLLGRWQEISYNPLTICDIAHNKEGLSEITRQLQNTPFRKLHMLIGFVDDKDIESILEILPKNADYYFSRSTIPRSADPNEVADKAMQFDMHGKTYQSVEHAYHEILQNSEPEDLIYIGGSTFVVADFLALEKN
jgi:dihydrofolate synthase/folylpolyglutamate synthase